jgi:hypothetical protein
MPSTSHTQATPTHDLERPAIGTLDTEWNVAALADALVRYLKWQQRQTELRESRRKPNTPEAA